MAKSTWERIGELRKTRRPDMLIGNVEIKDLKLKLKVVAFVRTNEQKRSKRDADIVLLLPKSDDDTKDIEIADDIFD